MDDRVERFWKEFEAEAGERVLDKGTGAWMSPAYGDRGLWGLLVLCEGSFRFRHIPSESWVAALLKSQRSSFPEKIDDIIVPFDSISAIESPRKRNFFFAIFGSGIEAFSVDWMQAGRPRREAFSSDRAAYFAKALRERCASGQRS